MAKLISMPEQKPMDTRPAGIQANEKLFFELGRANVPQSVWRSIAPHQRELPKEAMPPAIIYNPQPADWQQIADIIKDDQFTPGKREDTTIYNVAWEFATVLYSRLHLTNKDAFRAITTWAAHYRLKFTGAKLNQILSNARGTCGGDSIPTNMWNTDRWLNEKANRVNNRRILNSATKILLTHATNGGWNVPDQHLKLVIRQLQLWHEGRARCGNSYWWMSYKSPGLEHLQDSADGPVTYCKTGYACNCPACSECSLWATEKESGQWDWEAAYGVQFPVVLTLSAGSGPKELKRAISLLAKRTAIKKWWDGCFGAFIPTSSGYTLKLMLPCSVANSLLFQQDLAHLWMDVCMKVFGHGGRIEFEASVKPAIDTAIDLTLSAEYELFRLLDQQQLSVENALSWFSCWIGDKPGAKGMNRVYHAPGFRRHRITSSELSANMLSTLLVLNSEQGISGEQVFPKTWFSLESGVKRGQLYKVWDPYIQQIMYLDLAGQNLSSIPSEYVNPDTKQAIAITSSASSSSKSQGETGLSRQLKSEPRQVPLPANQRNEIKVTLPQPFDPWSTYCPEVRAGERGTLRAGVVRKEVREITASDYRKTREPALDESLVKIVLKTSIDKDSRTYRVEF